MPPKKKAVKKVSKKDEEIAKLHTELGTMQERVDLLTEDLRVVKESELVAVARADVAEAKVAQWDGVEVQSAGKLLAAEVNGNVKISLPIYATDIDGVTKKRIWCAVPVHAAISFTQILGQVARGIKVAATGQTPQ